MKFYNSCKIIHKIAAILCFLVLIETVNANGNSNQMIRAEGLGPIINGNIVNARDRAIQDALRQAVEQAVGTMISSQTTVKNAILIQDYILSRTSGFIESYQLIESRKVDHTSFRTVVTAVVKLEDLADNLRAIGLLREQMGNPRIMVLFRERNMVDSWNKISVSLNIAETALMNQFLKHDDEFNFIDRSQSQINFQREKAQAALEGDLKAAAAFGLMFHTDYVILGEALANTSELTVYGAPVKTAQATASARIVRTSTGQIVGSEVGTGKFAPVVEKLAGGSQAIAVASEQLGKKLMPKILEHWRKEATGTHRIIVILKNARFCDLLSFEYLLQTSITGVAKVDRTEFRNGAAIYQVESRTGANQIGDELDGKEIGDNQVIVTGVAGGKVDVKLGK